MNRSLNIPITDAEVWELVMDTVANSAILKEGFKDEVLQSKFKGEEENERLLRNQKKVQPQVEKCSVADIFSLQKRKNYWRMNAM